MDIMKIGQFITKLRKARNMTQLDLAIKLNVSDKTVSKWESGNGLPEVETLYSLAKFFEITVDDILREGIDEKMEPSKRTRIIMLIDKSGSMHNFKQDIIGGFNTFLDKQKELNDDAIMSVFFFDSSIKVIHKTTNVNEIEPIKEQDYTPSGNTALYDAMGYTIQHYYKKQLSNENVIMIIHTDGFENSSTNFTKETISDLIRNLKKRDWEFIILGANFDVDKFGEDINIEENRRAQFYQDHEGIKRNFDAINKSISSYRLSGKVDENWSEDIKKANEK